MIEIGLYLHQNKTLIHFVVSTFPTTEKGVHALAGKLALCSARTQGLKRLNDK